MNFYKILVILYLCKLLYDFFNLLYGSYLKNKWQLYFQNNDRNMIQYTNQIQNYLYSVPNLNALGNIFDEYKQQQIEISFIQAYGYYKHKFLLNFYPFYWLKIIVFLPQNILKYLKFNFNKSLIRLFNVVYWILGLFYTIYNNEINAIIKEFISKLFS